ncbi:glycosyltransferase family 8 protein [Streptomyces sp. NPDC090442]|uniref:glycosyltransferase family 8 protein n=1 Tax=Streptomyces sp. NPDC090442 TaxID=3365962 RepID=UPI00382B2137
MASHLPPIVCGIDANYALGLQALMNSLVAAHPDGPENLRLFVLHHRLPDDTQTAILSHARSIGLSTELCQTSQPDDDLPVAAWWSKAMYLRLSITDELADEPAALYLDADTLVRRSLRPLLRLPLHDTPLAACIAQNPADSGSAKPGWYRFGLSDREYFHSSVMLLNLTACRDLKLMEKARRLLIHHPECLRFPDQDALNWAADDNWLRLDSTWNAYCDPGIEAGSLENHLADAAVLHFAGACKPWNPDYLNDRIRDIYRQYLGLGLASPKACPGSGVRGPDGSP